MGAYLVRSTTHVIDRQTLKFSVLAPTVDDSTTREVVVTDTGGTTVNLRFDHDEFQLFKSIINEY